MTDIIHKNPFFLTGLIALAVFLLFYHFRLKKLLKRIDRRSPRQIAEMYAREIYRLEQQAIQEGRLTDFDENRRIEWLMDKINEMGFRFADVVEDEVKLIRI